MIKKIRLLGLILLASAAVSAQTVTGRVTGATDGSAIPGVSVLVKGTTTGTATDGDGKYSVSVSDANGAVLVFSFIGFQTKEVPIQGQTTIDVSLTEDATSLQEVVVTALGIPRETKSLVYGTQTVKASSLVEVRDANNVLNSLQGKVANVLITQGSGGVGSGARIVMRGNRSIQGSNNALIVVDGVPITNNTNGTAGSDFGSVQGSDGASNINPDDIESVTVLKGASAAALYGSQAGNGVVLITTKKGKSGQFAVNVNSGVQFDKAFSLPELQNKYGQGQGGIFSAAQGASWGSKLDGSTITAYNGEQRKYSAQPDNVKDFFRTGIALNNSIGITGGTEKMQTYLSYTNNNTQGITPRNDLMRHTFTVRLSNQVSKRFSTDTKVTYINQTINNRPRTGEENAPVSDLFQMPRNVSIADAKTYQTVNNLGVPTPAAWPSTQNSIYQNPYWMINNTSIDEKRDRIMAFISAKFNITDWLSLSGRGNIDRLSDQGEEWYKQGTTLWAPQGGTYNTSKISTTQRWFDLMLEGKNNFGGNFKLNYRLGTIFQDTKTQGLYNNANGLNVTNKFSLNYATSPSVTQQGVQNQIHSVFGQVNLSFKEYLFFEASLRNDWASPLPKPYSYAYPSVGLSAIVSDMVQLPAVFSFVKLNVNYATVGNGGQPQLRFNTFVYGQGAGNGFIQRSSTLALTNLKPELVKNLEAGFDVKLMQNKLGVNFNYYKSNSTNQLLSRPMPPATGYGTTYINAGNIQNSGVELVLNASPIKKGKLSWDIALNMGHNVNKIIKLDPNLKEFTLAGGFSRSATPYIKEGARYGDLLAYKWQRDSQGRFVVNPTTGLPVISAAQEKIGNFNPKATVGLTNTIGYGPVSLRILVDGRIGGVIVSGTEMNQAFNGTPKVTETHREGGWNLGGVDSNGNPVSTEITAQQFWQVASGGRYGNGEFFAYNATNIRLRELSLGYNIPVPASYKFKARLAVVARNLFFIYRGSSLLDIPGIGKRKMSFDPDMALGNGNFQGVQYYTLPSTRSLGFNLQLTF